MKEWSPTLTILIRVRNYEVAKEVNMKTAFAIMLLLTLACCSVVTYTSGDTTIRYGRLFAGADGIKVTLEDKTVAEINKQTINTELLTTALGAILGAAK